MQEKNGSTKKFWTARKLVLIFFLIFGIAIGAIVQHYVLEPLLDVSLAEQLKKCKTENLEIHDSLKKCIDVSK
ncbi:MAG: hypothetical protein N3F05_01070 [Candidatus Diapherotrites archaeon]|nr:hypothetical protein [Candidatus Diapherotrites archaeon]